MTPRGLLFPSPARMARNDAILIVSSSPEFPSILDLPTKPPKKPALRSGSNAAPIPENAIRAFTTAASVWRLRQSDEGERNQEEEPLDTQTIQPNPTTGAESAPNYVIELSPAPAPPAKAPGVPKKPRKAATMRKKKEEIPIAQAQGKGSTVPGHAPEAASPAAVIGPAEKPKRKPRAPKASKEVGDDVQTTLPKGKVTKPPTKEKVAKTVAKSATTEKRPRKMVETVSRHFAPDPPAPKTSSKPIVNDEPIDLEPAMRRRTEWTPPPENEPLPSQAHPSSGVEEQTQPADTDAPGRDVFKNLLDTFGCQADNAQPGDTTGVQPSIDILGKRKLIEMLPTSANKTETPQISPVKSKAPKKKLRTITDLATEAYRVPEASESPGPKQDSVLDYFEVEAEQPGNASKGPNNAGKAKAPKKAAKPKVSKKKAEPRKQILLSPTSALKQVSVQDFVFGTVSQLATEEDPDLLRALHEAMKESNQIDDDPFRASSPVISDLAAGRKRAGKKHWAAGARDDDGDLLDLDVFDLTESPAAPQDYRLPKISTALSTVDLTDSPAVVGDIGRTSIDPVALASKQRAPPPPALTHDIEILSSNYNTLDLADPPQISFPKSHFSTQNPRVVQNQPKPSTAGESREVLRPYAVVECSFDLDFEPPPSNQEHHQLIVQSQSPSNMSPAPRAQAPSKPKFELFTDAQLAKEIRSYGFKAVKRRTAMIALLEQCWESKTKAALGSTTAIPSGLSASVSSKPAAAAAVPAAAVSPSRPRGRPRKVSSAATVPPAKSPTRPRGRPKKDAVAASPSKVSKAKAPSIPKPTASNPKRRGAPTPPLVAIADSESDSDSSNPFTSSPMSTASSQERRRMFSSPSPDDLSITEDTEMSLVMSPSDQQEALFGHITKAVTTAPPTTDPAEPSWHEKMLMYDPVILEDLAAWLNAGQLDRVGFDGEVAPTDVKKWCESQSVCCLWRVNLRGKGRKRF
ncbi:structure-specific endonuclease subunit SLX4 [Cercophora scortea]|uniref:Structure-specific endonuclease subunit SLX4 n=1 Tax=Cercophora scortea TaxID=314031 RepID=A0AAE0MKL9_9PEZI|nr:structure-specific endonuclease subunit SLX4 [Cercophora scortea]